LPDLRRHIEKGDDDAERRDYLPPDIDRFQIHQSFYLPSRSCDV